MPTRGARPPVACAWLRELAAGYLREFSTPIPHQRGGLWGYSFTRKLGRAQAGIFIGFLTRRGLAYLKPQPPECLVLAFVRPASSRAHQKLVRDSNSVFRAAFDLLTKYTARRPRFEFHPERAAALARHAPLGHWPARQRARHARNFFIESLALLVRAQLPDALAERTKPLKG